MSRLHKDLNIIEDFISLEEEIELIKNIDAQDKVVLEEAGERSSIRRYGKYRPTIVNVCKTIPDFLIELSKKIHQAGIISILPDVISINEYYPGQGIKPHIDSLDNGKVITILGLSSHTVLKFEKRKEKTISVYFPPRCIIQMTNEIRNKWTHSIDRKKFDEVNGQILERSRRYSVVFRNNVLTNN